jgi:hypothetical protein
MLIQICSHQAAKRFCQGNTATIFKAMDGLTQHALEIEHGPDAFDA